MRQAAKRDKNEPEIVLALQWAGCHVERLNGPGVPDLLVTLPGGAPLLLMEVKGPKGTLTPAQEFWWDQYTDAVGGVARQAFVVYSADDALALVEEYRTY